MDIALKPLSELLKPLHARQPDTVLLPSDPAYDEACVLWNAMIKRRPAAILRCSGPDDIAEGLAVAAQAQVPVSVKGGGHNISGAALVDGGLTLDLSGMKGVEVDPTSRRAVVAPGALLGDVDTALAAHGFALPVGINSTTGIAGLTLGGGYGWLTRHFGLTIDSLVAADVITPLGQRLRASAEENQELFWALRGGGGNFGIVTSFEFEVHPLPHDVTAGLIIFPFEQAHDVLQELRDLAPSMPDELTVWAVMRKAPPLPFLEEKHHGTPVVVFACCWSGEPDDADDALKYVRSIGSPIAEAIGAQPLADWQTAFDPLTDHGARNYWKSHMFDTIEDELIDLFVEALERLPGDECEIFIAQLGGAPTRQDAATTAYPHRDAKFMMNVHARWRDPQEDDRFVAWAREYFDRTEPHANGGVYSNFMPEDEKDRAPSAFGDAYERLSRIKGIYDPAGRLNTNADITPTV